MLDHKSFPAVLKDLIHLSPDIFRRFAFAFHDIFQLPRLLSHARLHIAFSKLERLVYERLAVEIQHIEDPDCFTLSGWSHRQHHDSLQQGLGSFNVADLSVKI